VDGRIVDANSAFSRIYGHSHEQALGKDARALGLFANPKDYRRFARELAARGALSNFETNLRAADGRTIPTLLSSVMVDLGVGVRVVSTLRDISARHQRAPRRRRRVGPGARRRAGVHPA
jgi:PAS domain S-box-containing protein